MRINAVIFVAFAVICSARTSYSSEFFNKNILSGKYCGSGYYILLEPIYQRVLIGSVTPNPKLPQTEEGYFLKSVSALRDGRTFDVLLDIPQREEAGMFPFSIEINLVVDETRNSIQTIGFSDLFRDYKRGASKMTKENCNE